jgi:iron complex outermembrane receptor protein
MKTRLVSMICGMFLVPLVTFAQNNIKGVVKDDSGQPLPGVKIEVENTYFRTYTDPDGMYQFTKVKPGEYLINFELAGFETVTKTVTVESSDVELSVQMEINAQDIEEIIVSHVKADERTPTTYSDLNSEEVEERNFGQDIPYLLRMTPSTVVSSDAGAGVGYTGIRIRGVDPTRTNVTVNGIPLNDSESHGVFWVNMPDFASSVENIQVQRGVGTSTNGASAFGATININTHQVNKEAYGTLDNAFGSFNTMRNTVSAGTGLLNEKFTVDTRLSRISSDGYIDRASSNLRSFYMSGAYLGEKTQVRANIFSGREKTYQAWYGTPESVILGDADSIQAYIDRNGIGAEDAENLLESGRTYNYYTYDNEVDNYGQDHYQLHLNHSFSRNLKLNAAGHYTRGAGYYEQYRVDDDFATYGFTPVVFTNDTVTTTDLIRRRWLDNHFYGGLFALNFKKNKLDLTFGGGGNQYLGDHYGEVIWAEFASDSEIRDRYYDNSSDKTEFHSYLKGTFKKNRATFYLDFQYRHIDYTFLGVDEVSGQLTDIEQNAVYDFFNPKAGFMVDINHKNNVYFSMAAANREPVRRDFRESTPANRPEHETLMDIELGYRYKGYRLFANVNAYYMDYQNQLILTGQINDVGGYTRTNVDHSYRSGLELEAGYMILENFSVTANLTLSQNKITEFTEFVDSYDAFFNYLGQDSIQHENTDLAFSPNIIAAGGFNYEPVKGLEIGLVGKYVGQQFLDNTSADYRSLDPYFISNATLSYTLKDVIFKEIRISLLVNNLFDEMYENNGYTWGYKYDGDRTSENFYYPQAGRNFLTRLTIKL